jgi:transcriptional regulator with XRE-family HTH domain
LPDLAIRVLLMSIATSGTATATDTEIAARISNALIYKNVNAKDLAARTGISYKPLLASLKGNRSLTVVEFRKIADAINVRPSALLPDAVVASAA